MFEKWFEGQNKASQIESIKIFAIRLNKLKKILDRATSAELEYNGSRKGIRGGKFCTLNAKADNCARMYVQCEEELKYMVKQL